jgi:hypothetical protein
MRGLALLLCLACSLSVARAQTAAAIPAHNQATQKEAPPLPALGDSTERARALVDAILADDPKRAEAFFLPREAFRLIKATGNPDALYDRLLRAYARDIHALHLKWAKQPVTLVRLELSRRREWVRPGGEANRLPYWAQRHNTLVVQVGAKEQRVEVRVMITWDDRWYITHLSEFRNAAGR